MTSPIEEHAYPFVELDAEGQPTAIETGMTLRADCWPKGHEHSIPLYADPPVAAPVRLTDGQAEKIDEAIREALGDAYDCLRVWNAWSYGTMGPGDFSQVAEDPDRVADIRNAAAAALGFKVGS